MTQDVTLANIVRNFAGIIDAAKEMGVLGEGHQTIDEYTTDDLYCRRCRIPAGTYGATLVHKLDHISICLKGDLVLIDQDGVVTEVSAPSVFVTKAGTQRSVKALTDVDFVTVHYHPNADLSTVESDLGCKTMAEYNHLISYEAEQ